MSLVNDGSNVDDLIAAFGLAIAIEGFAYAAFPDAMKSFMMKMFAEPVANLRRIEVFTAAVGVFVVWLVRGGAG